MLHLIDNILFPDDLCTQFFRVPRFMDHVLAFALLCCERCTGNNVPDIKVIIQNVVDSHCCFQIVSRLILFQFPFDI